MWVDRGIRVWVGVGVRRWVGGPGGCRAVCGALCKWHGRMHAAASAREHPLRSLPVKPGGQRTLRRTLTLIQSSLLGSERSVEP